MTGSDHKIVEKIFSIIILTYGHRKRLTHIAELVLGIDLLKKWCLAICAVAVIY